MTESSKDDTGNAEGLASGGTLGGALRSKRERNADDTDARASADPDARDAHNLDNAEKANFRVPAWLWDAFRETCEQEGRSASWTLREYMRRAVEEDATGL